MDCFLTKPTVPESRPEKLKDYRQGVQKLLVSLATAYCEAMHLEDTNVLIISAQGGEILKIDGEFVGKFPPFSSLFFN